MYVRLGFSVAINVEPDILLVDEVLAVGDEHFQGKCAEKFAELKEAGRTIVLVSHSLDSVRNMCDTVYWFAGGRLRRSGAPHDVVDAYVAEMHDDRSGYTGGARWGSHEAVIESIELLDGSGEPTTRVRTGDAATFRLRYHAAQAVPRPVFGIALHTLEGMHVTGPNTREAGQVPEKIAGHGVVELHVPRLLLLPGTYDLSASLVDYSALHFYDFHQRALRFDVEAGTPHETFGGVVSLGGEWRVDDDRDA
jgi:ABC-2 type transport system ATP-binding protein